MFCNVFTAAAPPRFGATESLRLREALALWEHHDHGGSGVLVVM